MPISFFVQDGTRLVITFSNKCFCRLITDKEGKVHSQTYFSGSKTNAQSMIWKLHIVEGRLTITVFSLMLSKWTNEKSIRNFLRKTVGPILSEWDSFANKGLSIQQITKDTAYSTCTHFLRNLGCFLAYGTYVYPKVGRVNRKLLYKQYEKPVKAYDKLYYKLEGCGHLVNALQGKVLDYLLQPWVVQGDNLIMSLDNKWVRFFSDTGWDLYCRKRLQFLKIAYKMGTVKKVKLKNEWLQSIEEAINDLPIP